MGVEVSADGKFNGVARLILWPALITLGVTLLRLTGELRHWSRPYFDPQGAIVGITWLAPVFGIYFAVRLVRAGRGPESYGKAVGFSLLAAVVAVGGFLYGSSLTRATFHEFLLCLWSASALGAVLTLPAWRSLFKALVAYAYAARIPVVIIMFLAMRSNWGTHYDAAPSSVSFAGLWSKFLWLSFFAQLVFWVGYTVVSGMLLGSLAAALMRLLHGGRQQGEAPRAA